MAALGWGAGVNLSPGRNTTNHRPDGDGPVTARSDCQLSGRARRCGGVVDGRAVEPDAEGPCLVLTRPRDARVDIQVRNRQNTAMRRGNLPWPSCRPNRSSFSWTATPNTCDSWRKRTPAELSTSSTRTSHNCPISTEPLNEYRQALELDKSRYAIVPPFVRSLQEAEREYSFTIRCMAIHPEKPWLVARLKGTKIALWNLADLDAPQTILHEHTSDVCNVLMAGSCVVSADLAGQIKLTRLDENGRPQETLEPPELSGLELAMTPDLHWLIAGQYEGNICGWKLNATVAGNVPVLIGQHKQGVRGVVVTPDSQWAITAGEDGTVCKWNLQEPDPAAEDAQLGSQPGDVFSLAMSPTGRWVAFGGEAQSGAEFPISRIDLTQNTMLALPQGHTAPISALAYDRFGDLRPEQAGSALLAQRQRGRTDPGLRCGCAAVAQQPPHRRH